MKRTYTHAALGGMDLDRLAVTHFGIPYLRPFQRLVVDTIATHDRGETVGRTQLVILPTGSGKSLCFMLPALFVEGLIIIIYPLLALMEDQRRRFSMAGIECVVLRGGQSQEERQQIYQSLDRGCKVVITNAEMLANSSVLSQLARRTISLLVIDEAHTVVSWGEGFRPKLALLGTFGHHLPARQLLLFTATADEQVITGLKRLFGTLNIIHGNSDRPNISYHVVKTLSKRRAITGLLQESQSRPALVFCPTRALCERLQAHYHIQNPTIDSAWYHAGLSKSERSRLEGWFIDHPSGVLFSTNAFGLGVDKKNVRTVVHCALPADALSYLQESGRAGRDGNHSHAVVLMQGPEESPLGRIFWSTTSCYREGLLQALGEEMEYCNGCDVCDGQQHFRREGEEPIMRAVRERPFGLTTSSLVQLLMIDQPFDRLSGHLRAWHPSEIREAIQTLITEKKLIQWRFGSRLTLPFFRHAR
ncbi:MAG: RecQ family ATP-dependent DNA helicase [Sphaerochaeta sp.]